VRFSSEFDRRVFADGPPAVFTLDVRGELRVDPERTREIELLAGLPTEKEVAHYVLTDRATGVKMYVLVTHPSLAELQPRAEAKRVPDYDSGAAEAVEQWTRPRAVAVDAGGDEG
jgi:hypothetical protein